MFKNIIVKYYDKQLCIVQKYIVTKCNMREILFLLIIKKKKNKYENKVKKGIVL